MKRINNPSVLSSHARMLYDMHFDLKEKGYNVSNSINITLSSEEAGELIDDEFSVDYIKDTIEAFEELKRNGVIDNFSGSLSADKRTYTIEFIC